MSAVELTSGIWWVGAIDWAMRSFHDFETPRGTSYNSYLIVDETITLVDTVKAAFVPEMLANIAEVVDPAKIELIVVNHVEMDHSSGLPATLATCPNARLVASAKGREGLEKHYQRGWAIDAVATGDEISIGARTLKFINAPMVHWPDSMFTYIEQDRVLLPNDAFGQHYASTARFDEQVWADPDLMAEATKYFANIVLPYCPQVAKTIETLSEQGVDPLVVAPSHGIVWREHFPEILEAYTRWCAAESERRVVIIYATMWGSTELMAKAIADGITQAGVRVNLYRLGADPVADIMAEVMLAKAILIGSPTLNAGIFPPVAAFLTYMKGLRPKQKLWGAFGSYGWAQMAVNQIREQLDAMDGEPLGDAAVKFVPTQEELEQCRAWGRDVANRLL